MMAERVISGTEDWKQPGLDRGLDIGMKAGLNVGVKQGVLLGEAKILRRLLVRRYGPISAEIDNKIYQATEQQLLSWLDNLLEPPSLDEIFAQKIVLKSSAQK